MRKDLETQEILKSVSGTLTTGAVQFSIISCKTVYVQWDSSRFYVRNQPSPRCDVALELVLQTSTITGTGRNVRTHDFMLLSSDHDSRFGHSDKDWWILLSGLKCKFLPFAVSKDKLLSYLFPKDSDYVAQLMQNGLFLNFLKLQDQKNAEIQLMIEAAGSAARRKLELLKQTAHTNHDKPAPIPFGEMEFHKVVARDIIHNIFIDIRADFKTRGIKAGYDKVLSECWNYVNALIKENVQFFTDDQLYVLKNCLEILAAKTQARRLVRTK